MRILTLIAAGATAAKQYHDNSRLVVSIMTGTDCFRSYLAVVSTRAGAAVAQQQVASVMLGAR